MPAPVIREVLTGTALYTDPFDTVQVTTGAGTQVGDWLVAIHGIDYGPYTQASPPTPGDWNQWFLTTNGYIHLVVWARQVTVPGPQVVSVSHTDEWADSGLVLLVIDGAHITEPLDQVLAAQGSDPTDHVAPGITPSEANELLVCAWMAGADYEDAGDYAAPTGMTEVAEVDLGEYSTIAVATQALSTADPTGDKTATFTRSASPSTPTNYISFSLSLREAAPPAEMSSGIPITSTWTARKRVSTTMSSPVPVASDSVRSKTVELATSSEVKLGSEVATTKDVRSLPAGGPIDLSLYVIDSDGKYIPLPDYVGIDISPVTNSPGSVTIRYPEAGLNFEALHSMITDDRDLELAIWVGGREDGSLRAVLNRARGDEVDEQSIWEFSGTFLEGRMREAIVYPAPIQTRDVVVTNPDGTETVRQITLNPNRETIFENATAGKVMRELMAAAHSRGTLTDIYFDTFSQVAGSNGKAFTNTATLKIPPGRTLLQVLNELVEYGLCEWRITSDHQLRLFEPDSLGKDRTTQYPPIVLRAGKDVTDSPRTYSAEGTATHLLGAGKEGRYAEADDPVAEERRGRRIESYVTAGNIDDDGTLQAYTQSALAGEATGKMELAHGLSFRDGGPLPLADFNLYDWVWSDQGWGLEKLRVAQWRITVDQHGQMSGTAVLNDLTADWEAQLAKRLARLEGGSTVIGTPAPETPPPANNYKRPAAPTGVVASSLAYQDLSSGVAQTYASVTAGWSDVYLNEDGSELTVTPYYRVRYRYLDGDGNPTTMWPGGPNGWQKDPGDGDEWIAGAEGPETTLHFSGLSPGRLIEVQAATVIPLDPPGPVEVDAQNRAFRRTILQSSWSEGFQLVTDTDSVAPNPPSSPLATEYLGTVRVSWDGKDKNGLSMAPDFSHVEVHMSTAANFTPDDSTYRDSLFGANSSTVISDLLYGVTYYFRLVAVDVAGNRSEPSEPGAAIPRQLLGDDIFEGAVGSAHLAYAAVKEAHIAKLAVNDAHIQNLNVGKLTSGLLKADMLLAGTIKTAETGARIEFDGVSFRQYNNAGQLRTQFVAADGSALITGLIRSAMSGERFEMHPDGTLRLYPATGTNYNAMFNLGNEVVFRGQLDPSGQSGYLRINSTGTAIQFGYPDQGVVYAQAIVQPKNVDLTAPVVGLRADHRYSTADGLGHRVNILHSDSSGNDISGSVFTFDYDSTSAYIEAPARNIQLHFYDPPGAGDPGDPEKQERIRVTFNDGPLAVIECGWVIGGWWQGSSILTKTQIRDVPMSAVEVVRSSPAKAWKRKADLERKPRPEKPGFKIRRLKPGVDPAKAKPSDYELVDAEWASGRKTSVPPAKEQIGPMAEDIQKVAPELVMGSGENMLVNQAGLIGLLWKAVEELADRVDQLADKFPDVPALPGRKITRPGDGSEKPKEQ